MLVFSQPVWGHIPILLEEGINYSSEPVRVSEPEISWAYYGKLDGGPHLYQIISEKPFRLTVGLLAPYVGQPETSDLEFHIMNSGKKIVMMHNYTGWEKWYEPYGGQWYLRGPSHESQAPPGEYIIEVHSETNTEDYTLSIGHIERYQMPENTQRETSPNTQADRIKPATQETPGKNYVIPAITILAILFAIGLAVKRIL